MSLSRKHFNMNLIGFTMFQADPSPHPYPPLVANLFDATKPAQHPIYSPKKIYISSNFPVNGPQIPTEELTLVGGIPTPLKNMSQLG